MYARSTAPSGQFFHAGYMKIITMKGVKLKFLPLFYRSIIRWIVILAVLGVWTGGNTRVALSQTSYPYKTYMPAVFRPMSNSNPIHTGQATYYAATGSGSCMFDPSPTNLMVAAMNATDYQNSAVCGEFVHVKGPSGEVTVRIVDLCPGCRSGDLDLSQEAFALIANPLLGRVNITWQVVSPDIPGPIAYHFKDGSNQWWTAVQIRNQRNPVAKFEYYTGGQWVNVPRTSYNYFVQTNPGMGTGPYQFRVTDVYGNVLTDSGIPLIANGTVNGSGQFPYGP